MPELPEIEHLKQTLERHLAGRRIEAARLYRRDVLRTPGRNARAAASHHLLAGCVVDHLERLGKQLAIVSAPGAGGGRLLCVHLGMSGQLRVIPPGGRLPDGSHIHCVWRLEGGGRLVFRDPRRFGGIWAFGSRDELVARRWKRLGPDALTIRADDLGLALRGTRRSVKAALLDQRLLAGVGNIYADEALFAAAVHPASQAAALPRQAVRALAAAIRRVLRRAAAAGGSTLRDYVDADGRSGGHVPLHQVYGRAGEPCRRCGGPLESFLCGQRTTVACRSCQRMYYGKS